MTWGQHCEAPSGPQGTQVDSFHSLHGASMPVARFAVLGLTYEDRTQQSYDGMQSEQVDGSACLRFWLWLQQRHKDCSLGEMSKVAQSLGDEEGCGTVEACTTSPLVNHLPEGQAISADHDAAVILTSCFHLTIEHGHLLDTSKA